MSSSSGKKGTGISAAAEMLNGLDKENRERVLEIMTKKNPELAHLIEEQLVRIDDLVHLTMKMLQDFIKEVKIEELAVALKFSNEETYNFFLNNLSKTMSEDLKFHREKKIPREKANQTYQKVMGKVREMVEKGQLVLKENEDYV